MRVDKVVGAGLDEATLKYQRAHPTVSYSEALSAVMLDNVDLAREFVGEFHHVSARQARSFGIEPDYGNEDAGSVAAGKQLDQLAMAWLAEHPTVKDYRVALDAVMAAHPDVKALWLKSYLPGDRTVNFEQVVTVTHEEASAEVDALVKKIQKEHPDWSLEKCLGEAKDRLKKKVAKEAERSVEIAELSEEMATAQNALRAYEMRNG